MGEARRPNRPLRAAFLVAVIVLFAAEIASFFVDGSFGFDWQRRDAHSNVVTGVRFKQAKALHARDVIELPRMNAAERIAYLVGPRAGETVHFPVRRNGAQLFARLQHNPIALRPFNCGRSSFRHLPGKSGLSSSG